jgi:hypothetical protein
MKLRGYRLEWDNPLTNVYLVPFKLHIDDHSVTISSHWDPLFNAGLELILRKNHRARRGAYLTASLVGFYLKPTMGEAEKPEPVVKHSCGYYVLVGHEKFCSNCSSAL